MPPKKENKKNKNKYVLIWWVVDGQKTITELNKIPKAKRIKNETVKLKWEGKDGKKNFYFAKMIEYGGKSLSWVVNIITSKHWNYLSAELTVINKYVYFTETIEELQNVRLDNKGNVCDQSTKMYSENVLQQKKTTDVSKQLSKDLTKKHKDDMERKIIHKKAIFSIDEQPFSESHRDKITKFKNVNEGKKLSKKKTSKLWTIGARIDQSLKYSIKCKSLEITPTASQQDVTIDKSINFFDKSSSHPFNSNNSLIDQIHLENSTENSELDLAPIWNSNYLNNWSNVNNPVMIAQDFQFQGFNEADQVLSSTYLEVRSLEKGVCNTPILKFPSSLTEPNQKKNSTIFRTWDSWEDAKNITTINTSTTSNIFISAKSTEEESCL